MSARRVALLALVILCAVSLVWLVHPYFEPHWDASIYVLTTRSLLAGDGYAVFGEPLHLRPPGFSLMLAPLMAAFGTDFMALNLFVAGWGIVALALMFLYFRPRLGIPITLAFCLCVWMNPQYRKICNTVLSDTAGLALLFGCLLLDRWVRARPGAWRYAVLGLGIGVSLYLRSVCILLIPAIVCSRLLRRGSETSTPLLRRLGRLSLLMVVPVLLQWPWSLWKQQNPAPIPSDEVGLHSYWTAQWHQEVWNPDSPLMTVNLHLENIPIRLDQCVGGLGARLPNITLPMLRSEEVVKVREEVLGPASVWFGLIGVAALLIVAAWRRDPGNVFAVGNLAVLMIYFDYDERILLPSYLFVLASLLELMRRGLQRMLPVSAGAAVLVVLLAVLTWVDVEGLHRHKTLETQHNKYREVAQNLKRRHPKASVAASLGHVFSVYLERPVHFLELAALREYQTGIKRVLLEHDVDLVVHTGLHNRYLGWWLEPFFEAHGKVKYRNQGIRVFEVQKDGLDH